MMTIYLHACAIACVVDTEPTFYAQELVHHNVPPRVLLQIQALHQGRWLHAGRSHRGARQGGAPIGKHYGTRRNLRGLHAVDDSYLLVETPLSDRSDGPSATRCSNGARRSVPSLILLQYPVRPAHVVFRRGPTKLPAVEGRQDREIPAREIDSICGLVLA